MSFAPPTSHSGTTDVNKLPVFAGGLFNINQITMWREILNSERHMSQEWEEKWGYFKAPQRLPRNPKARAAFLAGQARQAAAVAAAMGDTNARKSLSASASAPSLSAAGKEMIGGGAAGSRDAPPSQRSEKSYINDKARLMDQRRTMGPKQRYGKQITAQHTHGWNGSLEMFGVHDHPYPNSGELFPET
eukprot:TRINITY_DN74961_c0_g1_i1.p2 TRINITY_DN74961_c0_g1~~TRINITY_DN74961_c0_g1_i1.p2  ORF type:complete len:189 (+),score=56.13 TRINITY_DN74961_c0_g1_i1:99-665(+)